jgi:hypothetical protein
MYEDDTQIFQVAILKKIWVEATLKISGGTLKITGGTLKKSQVTTFKLV